MIKQKGCQLTEDELDQCLTTCRYQYDQNPIVQDVQKRSLQIETHQVKTLRKSLKIELFHRLREQQNTAKVQKARKKFLKAQRNEEFAKVKEPLATEAPAQKKHSLLSAEEQAQIIKKHQTVDQKLSKQVALYWLEKT